MYRYIDLSHTIENGLVTYKGLPAPVICDYLSREDARQIYAPGTEFQIAKIEMVANTGTYLDCPSHRYADGKDLSQVELERFVDLEALVIHADYTQSREIGVRFFLGKQLEQRAVLLHTGWDAHWNSEQYFEGHPFLTEDGALYLRDQGVVLVGIDSLNIDDTRDLSRPAHSILLRADLIVEHLYASAACRTTLHLQRCPQVQGVGTFRCDG
jgi:kynurenine formamidase